MSRNKKEGGSRTKSSAFRRSRKRSFRARWRRSPPKGLIQGVVIAAAVTGLLVSMLIVAVFFKFYSDSEKKLSDRVYFGLSSINYFYLTEKNINEFTQIVTEITAKELGEACGGFSCYSWDANNPTYKDLRDKFESELRGKITGFPKQIGNGGRISFSPPKITGLEMDESHVMIFLESQQVYRETDSFSAKATSGNDMKTDKNIRYLLLARIGQRLYGNGTYVRDAGRIWLNSGKFDCNNDGAADKFVSAKAQLSSRTDLDGCKIIDIDFNVDYLEGGASKWNSYGANCYNIANSADPGINAGKIEGGKLFVQIDSLLEKSLICGIDGTDGLASITDIKGEVSNSGASQQTCTADDAKSSAWQNSGIDGKTSSILSALQNQISTTYGGITITPAVNMNMQSFETIKKTPPFGAKTACDSCRGWKSPPSGQPSAGNQGCSWHTDNEEKGFCSWESNYACAYSGGLDSGSTSTSANYWWDGSSMCGMYTQSMSRHQEWGNGIFTESRHDNSANRGTSGSGSTHYSDIYSCYFGAYFKITFTPDISFKIADTAGNKIVKKGTTDFEDLYFAVKFKPSEPYVIGDPDYAPPTGYTCEKTSGQACESGSCPSGKVSGTGTCESGVCCKPQQSDIVITGEGKDITI